jgi:hypothetical protein
MRKPQEMLSELRTMLRDVFIAREQGESGVKLAKAHGYIDGYMQAILDAGLVSRKELLLVVSSERERVSGPALRPLDEVSETEITRAA